jgi:hypothetical protein
MIHVRFSQPLLPHASIKIAQARTGRRAVRGVAAGVVVTGVVVVVAGVTGVVAVAVRVGTWAGTRTT